MTKRLQQTGAGYLDSCCPLARVRAYVGVHSRALLAARARECRAEARVAHSAPRAWGRTHQK